MKLFVKRVISVALAACMAIGSAAALSAEKIGDLTASFAVKAAAATIVDSGKCGANVTYTLDSDGLLTISGKGSMYGYSWKSDGDKYFTTAPWGSKKLTQVVISDGVTSIGKYAFYDCSSLTSITIPYSVTSIGHEAFYGCSSLTSVMLPDSVTSIGNCAFSGCSSLTSITIPDGVTSIGEGAFAYCSSLTSITIPDGVTSIGDGAFYMVSNIVYSGNLSGAPWYARALNGFIEDGLVYNDSSKTKLLACPSLREGTVVIPNSVTSIGNFAFSGCSSLTSITIPYGVTSIGYSAFYDCSSLTSITIPKGVTRIGSLAFYVCSSLTSITIPDGVTSIGDDTFFYCRSLTSITIPDGVTSIGERVFSSCRSLTSITIPDSVTSIGENAFSGCSSLTRITIPDSVTSIGRRAFDDVPNIVYSGNLSGSPWGARALNGYIEDGIVYEDSSKTKLLACPSLREGTFAIPDSVTNLGDSAFSCCTGLTSITIPDGVTSIGGSAFSCCTGLTSITIPNSVTSIGYSAFYGCTGLTSITIPDSVTSIGYSAFDGCTGLTSITIPNSVTSIDDFAFKNCSRLKDVFILNPNCLTEESEESIFANSPITIHSHSGYGVEKYAQKYGYNFVPIHMWDNGTVTREPQVGVAGERTFTCTVCSATRTEEISPLVPSVPERIEIKSSDSAKELTDGIVGATHSVTVSELLASSNASYIVDKDGNRVTDTAPLATGMKIILESGGERLEKVISVLGDVNGDGEISVSDARGALRAAVGLDTLEGAYLNAARVNGADEVAVSDARSILRAAVALDTGKDWLANIK